MGVRETDFHLDKLRRRVADCPYARNPRYEVDFLPSERTGQSSDCRVFTGEAGTSPAVSLPGNPNDKSKLAVYDFHNLAVLYLWPKVTGHLSLLKSVFVLTGKLLRYTVIHLCQVQSLSKPILHAHKMCKGRTG